jgi:tRNA pseudouridine65 synthase
VIPDSLSTDAKGFPVLDILYQDESLIAVNKPAGYLVHPSAWAGRDELPSLMQILRGQLMGQYVYPIHRLDRQTSGILLFALQKETERELKNAFENREVQKEYLCIVRGHPPASFEVNKALKKENSDLEQDAITHFETKRLAEIPVANKRYPRSRYALLAAKPLTGRTHQIRKHLSHARYPIWGDKRYGDTMHNQILRTHFGVDRLILHHASLSIPYKNKVLQLTAPLSPALKQLVGELFA